MKTTTLYKMPGCWSPLWALSDKPKFEIKSAHFDGNLFVGFDFGNHSLTCSMLTIQKQIEQQLADALAPKQFMPSVSKKQMALFDTPHHHLDAIGYGCAHAPPMVYFSEYADPHQFGLPAALRNAMIRERAVELFGSHGESMARKHFVEQMEDGHALLVRFRNGECEITPMS